MTKTLKVTKLLLLAQSVSHWGSRWGEGGEDLLGFLEDGGGGAVAAEAVEVGEVDGEVEDRI